MYATGYDRDEKRPTGHEPATAVARYVEGSEGTACLPRRELGALLGAAKRLVVNSVNIDPTGATGWLDTAVAGSDLRALIEAIDDAEARR